MAKRRVWVPVKSLVLVEFESDAQNLDELFEEAVGHAYESNLKELPNDDWMLDEDEIQSALPELIAEWIQE